MPRPSSWIISFATAAVYAVAIIALVHLTATLIRGPRDQGCTTVSGVALDVDSRESFLVKECPDGMKIVVPYIPQRRSPHQGEETL